MTTKKCFKCNEIKLRTQFYKHSQMEDGHLGKCKECTKKDVTKHRNDNIDKIRFYDRERGKRPHRIAKTVKFNKAYKKKYPVRHAATFMLNYAVQNGRIKKMPCQVCGSITRIHGHHEDYYKPLDVEWLCAKHHSEKRKKVYG